MERPSNGRFGCAAFLLVVAAFNLISGIRQTMQGQPLISAPTVREAEGGELLTTGERASRGDMIKRTGTNVELSDHLIALIAGGAAALLGIVVLLLGVRDRQARKRKQRGED